MTRITLPLTACAIICATAAVVAQMPAFDVASVRTTTSIVRLSSRMTAGRVDLVQPLRSVLLSAFRLKDYQLLAPDWLNELVVEIHATIPPDATVEHVPEMVGRLLVERFGLVAHSESRTIEAYHLVVGAGGIKMREVEALNEIDGRFEPQLTATGRPRADSVADTSEGPVRTIAIVGGMRRITARTMYERTSTAGTTTIDAIRMTMAELVPILALNLGEPVVDRTGLTGIYQFRIELPRDETLNRALRSLGSRADTAPTGVSAFQAVENLGLKLERRPTPIEVVVVDKINRTPTEN